MSRKKSRLVLVEEPKQKDRYYAGTIRARDILCQSRGRFLPTSGFGIHGDTKYNRRRQKWVDRMEINAWKNGRNET